MRRRSRAGDEPVKKRHRKTVAPKRLNAPKVRGRANPAPDRDTEIVRLARERDEALEQQTATAEVLQTWGFFVEKVLEKLGTTERTTLALKSEVGGKIRVASLL
jgi:hypothetical protein